MEYIIPLLSLSLSPHVSLLQEPSPSSARAAARAARARKARRAAKEKWGRKRKWKGVVVRRGREEGHAFWQGFLGVGRHRVCGKCKAFHGKSRNKGRRGRTLLAFALPHHLPLNYFIMSSSPVLHPPSCPCPHHHHHHKVPWWYV